MTLSWFQLKTTLCYAEHRHTFHTCFASINNPNTAANHTVI